jgi:hypothetical protein
MVKVSIVRQGRNVEVSLTGTAAEVSALLAEIDPGAPEQCVERGLQFPLELGRILSLERPALHSDGSTRLVLWAEHARFVESECDPDDAPRLAVSGR